MTTRKLTTTSGRLVAAEDRTIKGWLLPYGQVGRTNLGAVTVEDGDVTLPEDVTTMFASLDHLDGRDSVASWRLVESRPEGLWAEWDVPETHGGDKLLAEYTAGKRRSVSVELEPVEVENGRARGVLIGCAFPERPAFPGARLVAELADVAVEDLEAAAAVVGDAAAAYAAEAGDGAVPWDELDDETRRPYLEAAYAAATAGDPPADPPAGDDAGTALTASAVSPTDPDAAGAEDNTTGGSMTTTAGAPAALLAGARPAGTTPPAPTAPAAGGSRLIAADSSKAELFRLLAAAQKDGAVKRKLLAALNDVVPASILDRAQPQWLGEVWSGNSYQRRIVPLLGSGELTDLTVRGWRWVERPEMERYAGNKAAVPSGPVSTEPYEDEAVRFAMAHDIDIKYRHFQDAAFFDAYYQAGSESYARQTDAYAVEVMKATATPSADGANPDGLPVGWVAIVDAALDMLDVGLPTFALVEKSVYRSMILTPKDGFLEFLNAALDLESGTLNGGNFRIQPVQSTAAGDASSVIGLDRGEVLVGTRAAVKFRELGGGTPIRVEAFDLVNGGVDAGAFGYALTSVEDARGIRLVDTDPDNA